MLDDLNLICSSPKAVAERCREERDVVALTRVALLTTCVCTAVFGLILGSLRGLEQSLMTAVKLCLAWLLTLALCGPAFYAFIAACGRGFRFRGLLCLTLAASARASLVLLAFAPVLWFMIDSLPSTAETYHRVMFGASLIYAVGGAFGFVVLAHGLASQNHVWSPRRVLALSVQLLGFALLFVSVAGQAAWSLRPFVGRPSQTEVPWFRAPEGTFLEAVFDSSRSARGEFETYNEADGSYTPDGH